MIGLMKKSLLDYIMPFIMLAFVIVLMVLGFFIFSYVLIIAIIIGLVLFVVGAIRTRFFMKKENSPAEKHQGRTIEHDDNTP